MGEPGDGASLLGAIESLRDDYREDVGQLRRDVREDLTAIEGRLMTAIASIDRKLDTSARTHAEVHIQEATLEARSHEIYDAFIRDSKLAAARRDGALGVVRFVFELGGAHWKGIVGAGVAAGVLLGQLHVSIG